MSRRIVRMKTEALTPAALSLFQGLSPLRQEIVISLARHMAGDYKGAGRQFYTDEQWAARRISTTCQAQRDRQRQLDFAYGVQSGHGNPFGSKAPEGWRPDAKSARVAAKAFAK